MTILDTYCKAGGASRGYAEAGFQVVGVDIEPQPNYPFPFIQADAVEFIRKNGKDFDAIHASPPCQKFSCSTGSHRKAGKSYPDLIEPTRKALEATGKPFIMENVSQAPLRHDLILMGHMFNLWVIRKRIF
ncbi:MAG: DNA cytosine methyltransferase [Bacteroidales bacterium]